MPLSPQPYLPHFVGKDAGDRELMIACLMTLDSSEEDEFETHGRFDDTLDLHTLCSIWLELFESSMTSQIEKSWVQRAYDFVGALTNRIELDPRSVTDMLNAYLKCAAFPISVSRPDDIGPPIWFSALPTAKVDIPLIVLSQTATGLSGRHTLVLGNTDATGLDVRVAEEYPENHRWCASLTRADMLQELYRISRDQDYGFRNISSKENGLAHILVAFENISRWELAAELCTENHANSPRVDEKICQVVLTPLKSDVNRSR